MDNLTHSLVGALLGQAGLKRLSGRAMSTLVIAANIPDIDALTTVLGTESLAVRRGITHGPIALLLLPLLLAALILAWNRLRPLQNDAPVQAGSLLLLAYIGTLSHPALDWLNSYGIRLLEPFSSRWFYGDTLFIIDVWVWVALIAGFVISRRLEKRGRPGWRRPAFAALSAIAIYIAANGLISARAESLALGKLKAGGIQPAMVVANPQPFAFWSRRMLWRNDRVHGAGHFDLLGSLQLERASPNNLADPSLAASLDRPDVRAFLFWSRMPIVVEQEGRPVLTDQRFYTGPDRAEGGRRRFGYDPFTVPLDRRPASQ